MFSPGTRVTVLASSFSKGLGPKKNSEGYIIGSESPYLIDYGEGKKTRYVLLTHDGLMFTRYGNEQRSRCEHRSVINLLPIPPNPSSTETKKLLKGFVNGELRGNPYWHDKVRNFMTDDSRVPVVVLVPAGNSDVSDMLDDEGNELRAWMSSLLKNKNFIQSAYDHTKFKHDTATIGKQPGWQDMLRWIVDSRKDMKKRQDLISWTLAGKENSTLMIELMRNVYATYQKRATLGDVESFAANMIGNSYKKESNPLAVRRMFMTIYSTRLFEPGCLEAKEALAKKHENNEIGDFAACVAVAKKTVLSLTPIKTT